MDSVSSSLPLFAEIVPCAYSEIACGENRSVQHCTGQSACSCNLIHLQIVLSDYSVKKEGACRPRGQWRRASGVSWCTLHPFLLLISTDSRAGEEGSIRAVDHAVMWAACMVRFEQCGQEASWDTLMGFREAFCKERWGRWHFLTRVSDLRVSVMQQGPEPAPCCQIKRVRAHK